MVIATTEAGEMGILPGHIAMVAPLQISGLLIKKDNTTQVVAVHGGFIEVRPEVVTVLAPSAETAATIDLARAKEAAKRAEAELQTKQEKSESAKSELDLKRAMNRINVHSGVKTS